MTEVVIIFGKTEQILRNVNKNSIIALYNTSMDHNRQKRRNIHQPAVFRKAGCHGYHSHLFPPETHPESFIKIASLVVEISFPDQCPTLNVKIVTM